MSLKERLNIVGPNASDLTPAQLREAWRKISNGERKHGDFLTAFARAFLLADDVNETLLSGIGRELLQKYKIAYYGLEPPDDP